jgi:uncharacterized membrane protein YoaK (UPF0700 family)
MTRNRNLVLAESLAITLAAVAGFIDAVGYLTLHHLFTAHMTGNASKLGIAFAHGNMAGAAALAFAPLFFVCGIAAGAVLVDRGRTWAAFALQTLLVAVYMLYGSRVIHDGTVPDHSLGGFYVLLGIATLALGLQTAAFTDIDGNTTRTTYLSGMLTRLGQGLVQGAARRRLLLFVGLWLAYVGGATFGGYGLGVSGAWCLAVPLAVLVGVTGVSFRERRP